MRGPARVSDLSILIVTAAATISLSAIGLYLAPAPRERELRGSSLSTAPDGAKAAFLVLKRLGYQVERSFEPLSAVKATPSKTILVVASPWMAPSAQDRQAAQSFLEHGGIILATGDARFLPGLELSSVKMSDEPQIHS